MTDTMDSRRFASDLVIDTREISQSLAPPMCELVPCRMTRTQKSILVLLALLKFVAMGLFSVIAPYYHLEAHQRQLSDVIVGAVFTAYAGANFLTSPIFGRIIAETGPQIVLLLGSSLLGISAVSFSFLTSVSDPSTFCALSIFVRTLQGIGCGAAGTAIFTYVAEVFPRRTGIIMGVMEVMTAIGLNAGPAVGGYLHSVGGFKLPSLVLGFMCLATVPLNAFLLPRSINAENCVPKTPRTPGGRRVSKWTLLINVQFIVAALSTTAVSCASAFLSPLLAPQLSKLGMNTSQIGMMFLFSPIAYGLVGPIAGWISDENPKWRRLQTSAGLGLLCIALLLLGPSPIIERILRGGAVVVPLGGLFWPNAGRPKIPLPR
ncbi:unnamed protein product [Notodromas monacha]|uniref:Major facilitator superfamily (MFS) profile domain-containing protein n=1 Tax=Notodromas monacha TaxID=399045 RepID=A0A7R9BZM8_9CRUS|nr:unnamed protein product [Notodromas monacha]CAG0924722.1 unnamed protein product [Notodromas monacha]